MMDTLKISQRLPPTFSTRISHLFQFQTNSPSFTACARNLYTAHWTHIPMYLYSNTHTHTQCPSLTHPSSSGLYQWDSCPLLHAAGRAVLAHIPQKEREGWGRRSG